MDLDLKGKVVLITGGSRGIGLRTARAFAHEGCLVGICGREGESLDQAARELGELGIRVAAFQADVTRPEEAQRFVEGCAAEFGRVDILINNVGGGFGSGKLLEASEEDWLHTYEVNVFQLVRMTRLVVPYLLQANGGSIVNISSISGRHVQLAGTAQYGSSKAAAAFLTERMALELAPFNIRVNTVMPGSILWEQGGWDRFRLAHPEAFDRYVEEGFPMGRLGRPEEVAAVIVFLASPRAHWVNGSIIPVDGLEQPVPVKGVG